MDKKEIKVRMLLRVSTNQQTDKDGDLPAQRALVAEYISRQKDWVLDSEKEEYFEGGVSGYKLPVSKRQVLQEILEDAKNKSFDILVCYKDDRLGRREDEIPQYIKKLAEYGVVVFTVKEGCITPQNHMDNLTTLLRYWIAEESSRTTGIRVRDAAMELVKQGRNQGGQAPFGYKLVYSGELNKHHRALKKKVIVAEAAEIVEYMYRLALTYGYGAGKITKILNRDEKIRSLSPNGEEWKRVTVGDILKNPIYTGYEAYNRRTHEGEHYKRLDRENWILSEKCKPELVIIDLNTWERVQQLRESRKAKYSRDRTADRGEAEASNTTGRLALIDVACCGWCGRKLTNGSKYNYWTTKNGGNKSSVVGYYRCQTKHQGGECRGRGSFRADTIELPVFEFVKDYLNSLEDNTWVLETLKETGKKRIINRKETIRKLEKSLIEIDRDIAALKDSLPMVLRGELKLPVEIFYEQIKEKQRKKQEKEEKLFEVKNEKENTKEEAADSYPYPVRLPKWGDAFEETGVCAKRMVIGKLIERVYVKDEELSIQVRINPDDYFSRKTIYQWVPEQRL